MGTITAVLQPDADGTLHLPLPPGLRHARVRVTATVEAARDEEERTPPEEVEAALKRLRDRGTLKGISDPVAWQREIRRDRPLTGREG